MQFNVVLMYVRSLNTMCKSAREIHVAIIILCVCLGGTEGSVIFGEVAGLLQYPSGAAGAQKTHDV